MLFLNKKLYLYLYLSVIFAWLANVSSYNIRSVIYGIFNSLFT